MKRILLLEDDTHLAELIARSLEEEDMQTVTFNTVAAALTFLEDNDVDLVIADLFIEERGIMADEGGVRLISTIRQIRRNTTPIIAISGSFTGEYTNLFQQTAKTVGADAVLAKPFHPEDLLNLITKLTQRRRPLG